MNKLTNLLLLVVMLFSITHEVVFAEHEENHCSVQEYVSEFLMPLSSDALHEDEDDLCDTHYMLHISFLLPPHFSLFEITRTDMIIQSTFSAYPLLNNENTFRPPIG